MTDLEIGEYCRQVEDCLTRVNGGHLVRVVGPGFELVRAWAHEAIPLSVVYRGIEMKAERHRSGKALRPLRIEFCEADVRSLYEAWRRAVGVPAQAAGQVSPNEAPAGSPETVRRPSLSKHLDRVIERLGRIAGRLDHPETFRETVSDILDQLTSLRESARNARGDARDAFVSRLEPLDRLLMKAARAAAPADSLPDLVRDAEADLAAFRSRLSGEAWQRAVDVTVDRLLRDRIGLPTLELEEA